MANAFKKKKYSTSSSEKSKLQSQWIITVIYYTNQNGETKKAENTQHSWGFRARKFSYTAGKNVNWDGYFRKIILHYLLKLSQHIHNDLAISLLSTCSTKVHAFLYNDTHTAMFIAH